MPEKDIDIANRLKTLRVERSISQRQLAKKSNVSNAAISLIENNKGTASTNEIAEKTWDFDQWYREDNRKK